MFRTPRTITAVVAAIALMVGMPGIADAAPSDPGAPPPNVTVTGSYGGWTTYEAPIGYYYGAPATVGDEVVALAGVTLGTICLGDPLPASKEMLIRQRASDGRWVTRHGPDAQTLTVEVWEVDPGTTVFDFFAANCPLLAQGLPVPEPTATGDGVVKTTTKTEEVTWYGGEGPQ